MERSAKLAYTVKEAIAFLPWGKTKVYNLIASGELVSRFQHGHRYLLHEDLMAFLRAVEPDSRRPRSEGISGYVGEDEE